MLLSSRAIVAAVLDDPRRHVNGWRGQAIIATVSA